MTMTSASSPSRAFRILAVVTAVVTLVGVLPTLIGIVVIWIPGDLAKNLYAGDIAVHRFHASVISLGTWILFAAILTQLRRPQDRIATLILALAALVIFLPFDLLASRFEPLELLVLSLLIALFWLHPARATRTWRPVHVRALTVVAVGAIPWTIYALSQLHDQLAGPATNRHVELGHYGFMTAATLIILVAAFLGTTSLPGRRTAMSLAGVGAATFGTLAVLLPDYVSSPGRIAGVGALAWAILIATLARLPEHGIDARRLRPPEARPVTDRP